MKVFGLNTGIPFVKGVGDKMTASCTWEWNDNGGRCLWIPGTPARTSDGTFRPACQPNCLDPRNQREEDCVNPSQPKDRQLCLWDEGTCRYNTGFENEAMLWKDKTYDYYYENRMTPLRVREYYCDSEQWSNSPTYDKPATPINYEGQVRFCYGVGDTVLQRHFNGITAPFYDSNLPTYEKICPDEKSLQHLLTDHFDKAFGGGRSGAKVWGVKCSAPNKAWTCKYVLKALTLKEAQVVQMTMKRAGDPGSSLLMPVCAWWVPGNAPFADLDQHLRATFSRKSSSFVQAGSDGGRVWILMPNMAHSDFLPGESVGAPIDVKGWSATTAKQLQIFSRTNESEFQHQYTKFDIAFHTPAGNEQWPQKLSRALISLAEDRLSDYSLFFAVSRISKPALCRNKYRVWPQLVLGSWNPGTGSEWLCVAMSVIDFTKEESDFGWKDAKQTDAVHYAQNMLGMFVDDTLSKRLMGVGNVTFQVLSAARDALPRVKGYRRL